MAVPHEDAGREPDVRVAQVACELLSEYRTRLKPPQPRSSLVVRCTGYCALLGSDHFRLDSALKEAASPRAWNEYQAGRSRISVVRHGGFTFGLRASLYRDSRRHAETSALRTLCSLAENLWSMRAVRLTAVANVLIMFFTTERHEMPRA